MKIKVIVLFILILILCSGCPNNSKVTVKKNKTLPAPLQASATPTSVIPSFTDTPTSVGPSFTFTPTLVGLSFTDTPTSVGPSFTYTPTRVGGSFTFTPTPVSLFFFPNANVNCRSGPDRIFNIIDIALKGKSYLINGRNYANDWYYLKFTSNEYCYVLATTGTASGDTSKVRVMLPIPTPTFVVSSSKSCSEFTSESTCNAQSNCKWNFPVTRSGFCDKK